MTGESGYGLWWLVFINAVIIIIFVFSFSKPKTSRDWRSFGVFSAFIVALFSEMYGFPLTIYLLSGWLTEKYPGVDIWSHNSGHLWETLLGFEGDPHFNIFHITSLVLIIAGFSLLFGAWGVLYEAQRKHKIAKAGPYLYIRHPQYTAFIIIMLGFLVQWPTILTLLMFPALVFMYLRLSRAEERDSIKEFGKEYKNYAEKTPAFIPDFREIFNNKLSKNMKGG